jgi:UDP-galactose transporter B1
MARTKQPSPMRRVPSDTHKQANGTHHSLNGVIETLEHEVEKAAELHAREPMEQKQAGMLALAICVGGIYASL